jgi:hypothetical protein
MIAAAAIAMVASASAGSASALERWVDIANVGDYNIRSVRISDIDRIDFGHNLLGSMLPPGYLTRLDGYRHRGYCRFDVKVTYETGQEVVLWDVNLCKATKIYVTDFGYTEVSY